MTAAEDRRAAARARARQEEEDRKAAEKIALQRKQAKLRAMTRAAGVLAAQRGTVTAAPTPVRGPAMLDGEPDTSVAKRTVGKAPEVTP